METNDKHEIKLSTFQLLGLCQSMHVLKLNMPRECITLDDLKDTHAQVKSIT